MVIDTSAVMAILADEPERHHFNELIALAPPTVISAATYLEVRIVTEERWGKAGLRNLNLFMATASISIIPFDVEQAAIAAEAYSRYGKGRHAAGLNLGDCFAYALARRTGDALLFKRDDFAATDVASATHG
jgi:ribonuclease VapC